LNDSASNIYGNLVRDLEALLWRVMTMGSHDEKFSSHTIELLERVANAGLEHRLALIALTGFDVALQQRWSSLRTAEFRTKLASSVAQIIANIHEATETPIFSGEAEHSEQLKGKIH
jgi:hypothetical protein